MRIKNNDILKKDLKTFQKKRQQIMQANKKEINNLKEHYQKKQDNIKLDSEINLLIKHDESDKKIKKLIDISEQKLNNIKQKNDKSIAKLNQNKIDFQDHHTQEIDNLEGEQKYKLQAKRNESQIQTKEINERITASLKNQDFEASRLIQDSKFSTQVKINENRKINQNNIERENENLEMQKAINQLKNKQELIKAQTEHEKKLQKMFAAGSVAANKKQKAYEKKLHAKESHHQEILRQKDLSFKNKFNNLEKNHQVILKRMQRTFSDEANRLVDKQANYKKNILKKADNDFYNLSKIEPELTEYNDIYLLSLEIPEYEKENIRILSDGEHLTLSLTRSYASHVVGEEDEVEKVKRSEIVSKKFKIDSEIDLHLTKQNYFEGTLNFFLKKA